MSNLFDEPELTRNQKTKASRRITAELTKWVIDYLNDSGQFEVHRSNNIPAPIIKRENAFIDAFDENGNPKQYPYEKVTTMFRKNNIKKKILDVSGFRLSDGLHIELECKTGNDELSEGQTERIKKVKSAGGIAFIFSNKETFLMQIEKHLTPKKLAF